MADVVTVPLAEDVGGPLAEDVVVPFAEDNVFFPLAEGNAIPLVKEAVVPLAAGVTALLPAHAASPATKSFSFSLAAYEMVCLGRREVM